MPDDTAAATGAIPQGQAPAINEQKTDNSVAAIIERRDESRRYMKNNYWDEFTETWRAAKCRVKKIYKKDKAGRETDEEDTSRTNVAMPDMNLIWRRNTARMTGQPYQLNYTGGNQEKAAMLSALAAQQFDRSDEHFHDLRVVMGGELLGYCPSKLYWDTIEAHTQYRQALTLRGQTVFNDRASIMRAQGAPEEEIQGAVQQFGPEMSPQELSQVIGKSGNEIQLERTIQQYAGPCVKWCFPGDVFIEPRVFNAGVSSFHVEQFEETDLWLMKMAKLTYTDDDGQEVPVFDEKAVKEVLDTDPEPLWPLDDLRMMFESVMGRTTDRSQYPSKRTRVRRRYSMLEQHARGDDGRMWVSWAHELYREKPLGKMPYEWDLGGKYAYTWYVPLPDLVSPFGDSTPRLLRFLYLMHNLTVAQNFDYVTGLLRKFIIMKTGVEFDQEVIERGLYRILKIEDLNAFKVQEEPSLPVGAFEREAQILRMMSLAEPSMNTVDTGSASNPMAGKLATTAMLNAKAADALTQFKIDGRNLYLRDLGWKKLRMNQQQAEEEWEIQRKYWTSALKQQLAGMDPQQLAQIGVGFNPDETTPKEWALSERYGFTAAVKLDPLEIQEEYEVEPEAGSYLSVDDELRQQAAQQLQMAAAAAPDIFDRRKIAEFYLGTIRNIGDPQKYILPDPGPPDPTQSARLNLNVNMPLDKEPADIVNQVLLKLGFQPSKELEARDHAESIVQTDEAAQAATNLMAPAKSEQDQQSEQLQANLAAKTAKGNGKPPTK